MEKSLIPSFILFIARSLLPHLILKLPAYNLRGGRGWGKNKVMHDSTGGWKEGRMCALLTV